MNTRLGSIIYNVCGGYSGEVPAESTGKSSKRRKNISMEFETWKRLKTFGKFGESFDDILNRLMNSTEEYQRTLDSFMRLTPQIDTLTKEFEELKQMNTEKDQEKSQQLLRSQHFRIFESDKVKPETGERLIHGGQSVEAEIDLPGIKFPMNKVELVDFAKHLDNIFEYNAIAVDGFYYGLFRDLPEKTYTNKESLEEALIMILNTSKRGFFGEKNKVVGIKMTTTKEEMENRIQQQEQQDKPQLSS
jgi:hypothetical protein